jgi:hypothetical protein
VLPYCVPKPTLVTGDVPEKALGRTRAERLERENRGLKDYIQDAEETWAGPPDIEGGANLPSVGILRDKNVPTLVKHFDLLPIICAEDGFEAAVTYAQVFVVLHVESVWLQPSRNPLQETRFHEVMREFFEPPGVHYLVEPGPRGRYFRRAALRAILRYGVRGTIHLMGERGKEAPTVPLQAPRRPAEA